MKKTILYLSFLLVFSGFLQAQTQSPAEFLGYELGDRFSRHFQVIDYFKHVAENNANVNLIKYGETYENRPLHLAIVASPENFERLEEIRNNQLASARIIKGDATKQDVAIVWLSYNVHGNEAVSTEVSMKTLFELVNPENQTTKEWLKNTVLIIDPCINPDGRDRYVNWYNQKVNFPYNKNPDAAEHHEPWPGGRANHYLFDLNRDWAWATQIESQQRLKHYQEWMPHIHVDFHEQGVDNPYYFAPAAEPYHEVITDFQREFQVTVGKNHARYFDEKGWLYFTKEVFDLLYPSYGDTYPTFNGAIGMTYEQGGSGRAGLGVLNSEGDELSLKDRIAHHFTTSMSTIEVASLNAPQLIENYESFFKKAVENPIGPYKSYVIKNDNQDKINSLMKLMDRHNIEYGTVSGNIDTKGFSYKTNTSSKVRISANDLVINTNQPKSNFIKALFEPQTKLSDSLTYDITAWSLPYARGLNAYALGTKVNTEKYLVKDSLTAISIDKPYAYISKWNSVEDVAFVSHLLQKKVKIRFSETPFSLEGKSFGAGSIVITRTGNEKLTNFDELVREAGKTFHRDLKAVSTGLVGSGNDFGSSKVVYLKAPKVAVVSGEGVSSLNFGAIWHFFEQQIGYQVNIIDTGYFSSVDLHDYDVLILPSGNYRKLFDKEGLKSLETWIKNGGKVVAIRYAINVFAQSDDFDISKYGSKEEKEQAKKDENNREKEEQLITYNDKERNTISNFITGSIFKASLDNTSPLGFGYSDYYYTLKVGSNRFAYLKNGYNVSVIDDPSLKVSGFAGKNAMETLEKSLVYGVEQKGKGTLVYLVDDPLFRSFWENGKLLFSNAVFMVGQD